jgi:hypothetical protein
VDARCIAGGDGKEELAELCDIGAKLDIALGTERDAVPPSGVNVALGREVDAVPPSEVNVGSSKGPFL